MTFERSYDDADLTAAVANARSWRGVLRELGLRATSAGSQRSVRKHADRLALDYSHFTHQRRWSDQELIEAVQASNGWREVQERLGLSIEGNNVGLRGHALRLGLDTSHFKPLVRVHRNPQGGEALQPVLANLRRSGPLLAAAFFEMCGCHISWPLEPCRYDLIVAMDSSLLRVQVKTTMKRSGGTWSVGLRTSGDKSPYDCDDIDHFFVIDGDLTCYLIPVTIVGGRGGIHLSGYQDFKVGSVAGLLPSAA